MVKRGQTCLLDGQFGTVTYAVGNAFAVVLLDDDRRVRVPVDRLVFPSAQQVLEMVDLPKPRRLPSPVCPGGPPMGRIYRRGGHNGAYKPIGRICYAGHVVLDQNREDRR